MVHPLAGRWNHNAHHYPRLRAALPDAATHVLDIGCGDGTLSRWLAAPGRQVVGLDADASVLPDGAAGVAYVAGSANSLPFGDGRFDAVTMVAVLHHVDAGRGLGEAARVLAPGGLLQVIGLGRYGGLRDVPHEVRDVLTHQVMSRRATWWEPPTHRADPPDTWATSRRTAESVLPGAGFRRVALWRYLMTWRKPL
ncbi:MAG: class I SAM-dependent methyltransferase [Nocardioides sp.]